MWQAQIYNQEFVERLKLVFGHPDYFTFPNNGVVDEVDPQSAVAGGSRPLTVSINLEDHLAVDVAPGMCVTESGMWMVLTEYARNIALANTALNIANVVYLEYKLVDGPLEVNDEKKPVVTFTQRPEEDPDVSKDYIVGVATVTDYLDLQPSVRLERVPIAIVTVVTQDDPPVSALSIDHTANSYTWNRPWFSAVDIEHRSKIGSGPESENNPHRISWNEIAVGAFGPVTLQADHGMIIGKSQSVDKVPGYVCEAAIPTSEIIPYPDDASGTLTGFSNAPYLELPNFPVRVGRAYYVSTESDIGALHVPETKRVVFPSEAILPNEAIAVKYTRVEACEPPTGNNNVTFSTNNPKTDEELILAGGMGITALYSTEETFGDAHQFPMRYIMFVDKEGKLLKTPQVIYCYKRLADIATTDITDITQYGDGVLVMGLTGAGSNVNMDIKIRVYGEDPDGNSISYLFEFTGFTWQEPGPVPNPVFNTSSYKFSLNTVYSKITSIEIDTQSFDTPNSAIMIWVCQNPRDTREQMDQAAVVANVMWDGLRLSDIRDKRIVATTSRDFLNNSSGKIALEAHVRALGGNTSTLYVEDMRVPEYGSLLLPREMDKSEFNYPWYAMDQLYVGRQGAWESRALPVLTGSADMFRLMMFPQGLAQHTFQVPYLRFKNSGTWSGWVPMVAVSGVPHSYELRNPVSVPPVVTVPEAIQIRNYYDTYYQSHLFALYG